MEKIVPFCFAMVMAMAAGAQTGSVGIGTTSPNGSAALDIQSTSKGLLIPRLSSVQRNAITSPAAGLLVFDNTTQSFWFRNGSGWVELIDTANTLLKKSGTDAYVDVTGNLGVGKNNPLHKLSVNGGMGLYNGNTVFGTLENTAGNLQLNAKTGSLLISDPASDIILQTTTRLNTTTGRVGIGTDDPQDKLDVNGSVRASEIHRTATGAANLVPICYGVVNAAGNATGGTGNFTADDITVPPIGSIVAYRIDVTGVTINMNTDVIVVTPRDPAGNESIATTVFSPAALGYTGNGFMVAFRLTGSSPVVVRSGFSFMVFRP